MDAMGYIPPNNVITLFAPRVSQTQHHLSGQLRVGARESPKCWKSSSWWLNQPIQKKNRQIGSLRQVGVNMKNIGHHHPSFCWYRSTETWRIILSPENLWLKVYRAFGRAYVHDWSTTPPNVPPQKYGLIKGLLTTGFRFISLTNPYFWALGG